MIYLRVALFFKKNELLFYFYFDVIRALHDQGGNLIRAQNLNDVYLRIAFGKHNGQAWAGYRIVPALASIIFCIFVPPTLFEKDYRNA